jgi:hypothetical protein
MDAKRHQVTAFFFDFFVIGTLIQIPFAIMMSVGWFSFPSYVGLAVGVTYIVVLLLYHVFIPKRISCCTPGETMAGCRTDSKEMN